MRIASFRSAVLLLFAFLLTCLILLCMTRPLAGQKAIQFTGTGNHLQVPPDTTLASPEFTYEYWLQVQALGDPDEAGGEQTVIDTRGAVGGLNARLAGTEWPIAFISFHGPGENDWVESLDVEQYEWRHYAVTQSVDSAKLYVNGVLLDERNAHYTPDSLSSFNIGDLLAYPSWSLPLFGALDEFRFWNHVRPADSIQAHVHWPVSPSTEGLVLYFDFETFDGDTLRDRSAYGNDAIIVGQPELIESEAPWNFVPPPGVHGLRAFGGENQVSLVWRSYGPEVDRFYVFRADSANCPPDDGHLVAVIRSPDTTYVDDLVEEGHVYYYRLRAGDGEGHRGAPGRVSAGRVRTAAASYLTGVHYDGVFGPADGGRDWFDHYVRQYMVPPQPPLLGEYSNRDPEIIRQHLTWMEEYGIDFIATSWWTPQNWSAQTIKDYVLDELTNSTVKIAALVRMGRYGLSEPFDDADRDTLLADFTYLADNLLGHPNYLQINGRHVVFLNAIAGMYGDFEPAFAALRDSMSSRGYDLFLIGDDVRFDSTHSKHMTVLDGVMMYMPSDLSMHAGYPVDHDVVADVSRMAADWSQVAEENGVVFVPSVYPGYNARYSGNENPAIPRQVQPGASNTSLLDELIRSMRPFVDADVGMILINSFNRWNVDTQIEPTIETEPTSVDSSPEGNLHTQGYTYEGYGMKPLELIRELLAPELLVGVHDEKPAHLITGKLSCYPNPFNTSLNVSLDVIEPGADISVDVYDVLGRRLATMSRLSIPGNASTFEWHAEDFAPGLYLIRARTGSETLVRSVIKRP